MAQKISDSLAAILRVITFILLLMLVCIVFSQVCLRYLFNSGFDWSEELARYLFVWVCFLGAAIGIRERAHIAVEFMENSLPKLKPFFETFYYVTTILFFAFFLFYGIEYSVSNAGARSMVLPVNMAQVYSIVPISSVFALVFIICELITKRTGRKVKGGVAT